MKEKKRLTIFCFYDKQGYVDKNTEYLVRELRTVSSKLIVAINGGADSDGRSFLEKIADAVVLRENVGYDAGAYADVLVEHIGLDSLQQYDELLLCNDTFFGPFESMKSILGRVKAEIDMAGILLTDSGVTEYLQSYFLLYKNMCFTSVFEYMAKRLYKQINDVTEAHVLFEVGLFYYLIKAGYKHQELYPADKHFPYDWPDVCIAEYSVPILKKKTFAGEYYYKERQLRVLQIIKERRLYDIKNILAYAKRIYHISYTEEELQQKQSVEDAKRRKLAVSSMPREALLKFIREHGCIYIYGAGIHGGDIYVGYQEYIAQFGGFLVSDITAMAGKRERYGQPIYEFGAVELKEHAGIVVAMSKKYSEEVKCRLKTQENVMFLFD